LQPTRLPLQVSVEFHLIPAAFWRPAPTSFQNEDKNSIDTFWQSR
jgi:hypothetical protein